MPAIEVVDDRPGLDDLRPAWDAMWDATADARHALDWAWASTWWDHFGRTSGPALRARLHVVVVRIDGTPVAICPWQEVRLVGPGRPALRMLVGLGHEDADDGGVLLGPDRATAAGAVADVIAEEVRTPGTIVNLTRLRPTDPLIDALLERDGIDLRRERAEEHPVLRLQGADCDATVDRLLKRNDVRRRWRRINEAHEVEFIPHRRVADGGLDDFLALHDVRWAARGDTPTGPFVSRAGRRFLHEAAAALDRRGVLQLSLVTADGRPVAARYGYRVGDRYDGVKSGWDPTMATYGPGHMVVGKILEHGVHHGLREFDFIRGSGAHKSCWASEVEHVGYWTATAPSRLARYRRQAMWALLSARYRARHRTATGVR